MNNHFFAKGRFFCFPGFIRNIPAKKPIYLLSFILQTILSPQQIHTYAKQVNPIL